MYSILRVYSKYEVYWKHPCNTSNTANTPNISDVCAAAAVDTTCAQGSVVPITYWYTSMGTYKGTVCLSKRTYRYSHEARMWSSIIERTVGRIDRLHACKKSVAWPPQSDIADRYLQSVVYFRYLLHCYDGVYTYVWRFTDVCQAYYTIDCLCISLLLIGYHPSAMSIRGYLFR